MLTIKVEYKVIGTLEFFTYINDIRLGCRACESMIAIRGVAQLVAHAVWDREVEGPSPFTPTI